MRQPETLHEHFIDRPCKFVCATARSEYKLLPPLAHSASFRPGRNALEIAPY
jgi:hypothetical protein